MNLWNKERDIGFRRLRDAPPWLWVIVGILIVLDLWWDLHHTGGFVLDGVVLVLVLAFVFYWKYRKQRHRTKG